MRIRDDERQGPGIGERFPPGFNRGRDRSHADLRQRFHPAGRQHERPFPMIGCESARRAKPIARGTFLVPGGAPITGFDGIQARAEIGEWREESLGPTPRGVGDDKVESFAEEGSLAHGFVSFARTTDSGRRASWASWHC